MKDIHMFHKTFWQRVVRREIDKTSYREVCEREDIDVSYAKLWRIANSESQIGIDDYLMVSDCLDIDPMAYIYVS